MRKLFLAAIYIVTAFSLCFGEENPSFPVKEVTVYSNGAMVKREGIARIGKGKQDLSVDVQAFNLDRDSISARVFGDGEIQAVQYREIPVAEHAQEAVKNLEQKLKKLKESKRLLTDEKDVLDKQELFLTSLMKPPVVQGSHELRMAFPKVQDLDQMLAFLAVNFKTINEKRAPLDRHVEELDKQIAVAERELASLKGPRQQSKKVIAVTFNSKKDQSVRAEITYLVPYATWQPLYKVSVPNDLKAADLVMFSTIRQKSGEDWKDVLLSISNVVPLKGLSLPDPGSWFLDIRRPAAARQDGVGVMAAPAPMAKERKQKASELEEAREANLAFAEKRELPLSFEYRLPGRITVESGDKEALTPLFAKSIEGEFSYYAVPKANPLTFLTCKLRADRELLGGPVNAYFGGRFVGKTVVTEKRAGEDFQVNLGADREVKVSRETVRDKVKETSWGFERKNVVRDMAYRITVENLKERPARIMVIDPVPVARTDRIEVKDLKVTPQATDKAYQNREGVYVWDLEVKPGGKQEITVEFTVTYPRDVPVTGL